jgi:hypothetical protein
VFELVADAPIKFYEVSFFVASRWPKPLQKDISGCGKVLWLLQGEFFSPACLQQYVFNMRPAGFA